MPCVPARTAVGCNVLSLARRWGAGRAAWTWGCLACPEGFEPPTVGLEGRCSIQLSYGQICMGCPDVPARPPVWVCPGGRDSNRWGWRRASVLGRNFRRDFARRQLDRRGLRFGVVDGVVRGLVGRRHFWRRMRRLLRWLRWRDVGAAGRVRRGGMHGRLHNRANGRVAPIQSANVVPTHHPNGHTLNSYPPFGGIFDTFRAIASCSSIARLLEIRATTRNDMPTHADERGGCFAVSMTRRETKGESCLAAME